MAFIILGLFLVHGSCGLAKVKECEYNIDDLYHRVNMNERVWSDDDIHDLYHSWLWCGRHGMLIHSVVSKKRNQP